MRPDDLDSAPPNLPAPVDDGACDHLVGLDLPSIRLAATTGGEVDLAAGTTRWTVVYAYPRTGLPDRPSPPGWDDIPGARGCTPQNCAFRDRFTELRGLGAAVYGLSTQSTAYQREMAARIHLPFPVLSDERLGLTHALRLPTFQYPVFPSNADAPAVLSWLRAHAAAL